MSTLSALGTNVCSVGGDSQSGSTYWNPLKNAVTKAKFLEGWKITGAGNLVGLILGNTLVVGGTAGSYTFQVPQTTPYKNADADYVWGLQPGMKRASVPEADLIGYDLSKTFVKYLNVSPYSIEEIWILKAGETLTTDEENLMRDYCNLSYWWDGTLNDHGAFKGNRTTARNILTDIATGLVLYLDFEEGSGTTAIDSSVSAKNGTHNATYTPLDKVVGLNALGFSGAQYVSGDGSALPVADDSRTLTMRVKTTDKTVRQWLFYSGSEVAGSGHRFALEIEGSLFSFNSGNVSFKATTIPVNNEWALLILSYDKTTRVASFSVNNGTPDTKVYNNNPVNHVVNTSVTANYYVAALDTTTLRLTGGVDDVRMYNKVLSIAEKTALLNYLG